MESPKTIMMGLVTDTPKNTPMTAMRRNEMGATAETCIQVQGDGLSLRFTLKVTTLPQLALNPGKKTNTHRRFRV